MMCKQSARKYPGPRGFLDFSLNEMREPEPRRSKKNHRGPTQSVCVADSYFIVNVLELPFASPIAIYC